MFRVSRACELLKMGTEGSTHSVNNSYLHPLCRKHAKPEALQP